MLVDGLWGDVRLREGSGGRSSGAKAAWSLVVLTGGLGVWPGLNTSSTRLTRDACGIPKHVPGVPGVSPVDHDPISNRETLISITSFHRHATLSNLLCISL